MTSPQSDLLLGLAADINTAGIGIWDPSRNWTAADTDVAVMFGQIPAYPDRVIALTAYKLGGDSPNAPSGQITVQAYCRGLTDPFDVEDTASALYDLIQGLKDRAYGAAHVTQALHKSSIPGGYDENNRREISSNFVFDVDLPDTPNRSYSTA